MLSIDQRTDAINCYLRMRVYPVALSAFIQDQNSDVWTKQRCYETSEAQ